MEKDLEQKLERPDWKQWLPVYGIYQVKKDYFADKPTIIDNEKSISWQLCASYQTLAILATGVGIYKLYGLIERFF